MLDVREMLRCVASCIYRSWSCIYRDWSCACVFLQLVLSCSVAKLRSNTTTTMCKAILSFYKLRHLIGHCKFDNQGMLHLRVSFHREFGLECGWINSRGQL